MNLSFDRSLAEHYNSTSQKIRVMSEAWLADNMYCPVCGHPRISHLDNNKPVADFFCESCHEIFELKSKKGNLGNKISGGAYDAAIERITSNTNPSLLVLQYTADYEVSDLVLVPRFFFVPEIIEKRKPLKPDARRAGWTGCNILLGCIPSQGRISIIQDRNIADKNDVLSAYRRLAQLEKESLESRGWLLDVLNCVNEIKTAEFTLKDVYQFVEILSQKHPYNNNVEPKIRQQLQLLRDKGFIEFLSPGHYRKLS